MKYQNLTAEDLGFRRQAELFDHVCQIVGKAPPVIEARDVLTNPEHVLKALCNALDVTFDPAMLRWEAGPRDTDGAWASHWYNSVNQSTGFAQPRPPGSCPPELERIVAECQPYYEQLSLNLLRPERSATDVDPAT